MVTLPVALQETIVANPKVKKNDTKANLIVANSKVKPIVAPPNEKTDRTSYLINLVWDGILWYNYTNLMTPTSLTE